jgi:hypothetical protein
MLSCIFLARIQTHLRFRGSISVGDLRSRLCNVQWSHTELNSRHVSEMCYPFPPLY